MAARADSSAPDRAELLAAFGDDDHLSIQALFRFCFVPGGRLAFLKELTCDEDWGSGDFVLLKYLAVHLRLAIEQGRWVQNGEQLVLSAGRLATRGGAPVYVGLVRNSSPEDNPWVLNWVGERPSSPELPAPADLGEWEPLRDDAEIVPAFDPAAPERKVRLPHVASAPATAQVSTLVGALHWSIHRGLAVRQIHGGGRGWFVPVYLTSREDLGAAPDVVCPVVPQDSRVIVRTLLEPAVAYSPARAVVDRADQLPSWLLDAWDGASESAVGVD